MPRKAKPEPATKELFPQARIEVRVIVEDTESFDAFSQIFAGHIAVEHKVTQEELENAIFSLAVGATNACAWDIGLGEIFEVVEDDEGM